MAKSIEINGRLIGPGEPVYVIAEISANHNQKYEDAAQLVRLAKEAGADAVKLQTYTPDTITIECTNEYFQIGQGTLWSGKTLYELYSEAYMPWEWQPRLKELADGLDIDLFSTPFDETAVEFLDGMDVPAFKVASFEVVDLPLLRRIAITGKPVIMSTGMATLAEIDEAVKVIKTESDYQLALLKCTSSYPALPYEMNLQTILHMAAAFRVPIGLSDHTLDSAVPVAAVTLGACIIEKHLTLSRDIPGPDRKFSMEPLEFKAMVNAIRITEEALGQVSYEVTEREAKSRIFRRSLFVVEDVEQGQEFTYENVRSIRPGYGLHTRYLEIIVGRHAAKRISKGTPLSWDLVV